MSQTFIDWELYEHKTFSTYRYEIFKVEYPDHKTSYIGWVWVKDKTDYWLENESFDGLRTALINLGNRA